MVSRRSSDTVHVRGSSEQGLEGSPKSVDSPKKHDPGETGALSFDASSQPTPKEPGLGESKSPSFNPRQEPSPTSEHALEIEPPPDGGLQAWLQVLAAHLVLFNVWGYLNSFGIFQGPYEARLNLPPSTISWIGSVQVLLVFGLGGLSGRFLDNGYYRHAVYAGTVLQLLGAFTTSLAVDSYWQLFLAQGVCQGLGSGIMFPPTMVLVTTYFSTRRAYAMALVSSGSATGGVVFPVIAQQLIPRLGLAWTIRIMAFVILFNSIIILAIIRTRLPPTRAGALADFSAFRDLPYLLYVLAAFFFFWGMYYAYYYARDYAIDVLGADDPASFTVLMILNAIGLPGRILAGLAADHWAPGRPMLVIAPCCLAASLCLYLWTAARTLTGYFAWVVFFGLFGAAIQGLYPVAAASLTADASKRGARFGMICAVVGVACLTGPPLAGRLVEIQAGGYLGAQMWGASSMLIGALFASGAAFAQWRQAAGGTGSVEV